MMIRIIRADSGEIVYEADNVEALISGQCSIKPGQGTFQYKMQISVPLTDVGPGTVFNRSLAAVQGYR